MSIKITEDRSSLEGSTFNWAKITHSLEPETKILPEDDRRYFESKIKLLIGKEIRLSNIHKEHMFFFNKFADRVYILTGYPMAINQEYIRREFSRFLTKLGLTISEDGLGWKYGPMGFQHSSVKQEIINPIMKEK